MESIFRYQERAWIVPDWNVKDKIPASSAAWIVAWIVPDWNVKISFAIVSTAVTIAWIVPDWNVKTYKQNLTSWTEFAWIVPDWNVKDEAYKYYTLSANGLNCTRLELKEGIPLLGVMYSDTIWYNIVIKNYCGVPFWILSGWDLNRKNNDTIATVNVRKYQLIGKGGVHEVSFYDIRWWRRGLLHCGFYMGGKIWRLQRY